MSINYCIFGIGLQLKHIIIRKWSVNYFSDESFSQLNVRKKDEKSCFPKRKVLHWESLFYPNICRFLSYAWWVLTSKHLVFLYERNNFSSHLNHLCIYLLGNIFKWVLDIFKLLKWTWCDLLDQCLFVPEAYLVRGIPVPPGELPEGPIPSFVASVLMCSQTHRGSISLKIQSDREKVLDWPHTPVLNI